MAKPESVDSIEGPVYPIVIPYKDDPTHDYPVDWEALRGYVDFLLDHGARHVMVASATSRFAQLSDAEIREVNRVVAERVGDRGVATASTGIQGPTSQHVAQARAAEECGAPVIACEYPWRYQSDEALLAYFKSILKGTKKIRILLHVTPGRSELGGQYRYDVPVLEEICSLDRVIGMKEAAGDKAHSIAIMEALAKKTSIVAASGGSQAYLRGLPYGVSGFFVGTGNFDPETSQEIYRLGREGKADEAKALVERFETPFLTEAVRHGWHAALKAGLAEMGLMGLAERPPLAPLGAEPRARLREIMSACGWLGKSGG